MLRQEIKFILNQNEFNKIVSSYNFHELYKPRMVYSIYFDTCSYKLFHLSEEGVSPRYKVRIRSYDINFNKINLEIKKTKNYIREKIVKNNIVYNKHVFNNSLIKLGILENLKPVLHISYKRKYYNSIYGRITFDTDIKYAKVNDNLLKKPPNIYDDLNVLEVKNNNKFDKFKVMQFLNLKEARFSKYCRGIIKIK